MKEKLKALKCAVCGRTEVYWSIYSTADGKAQCTACANIMRSRPDYTGSHAISGTPADKREYRESKTVFGWLKDIFS